MTRGPDSPLQQKCVALVIEQESTFGRRLTKGIIEYARGHPHFGIVLQATSAYTRWEQLPGTACDGVIAVTYKQAHADILTRQRVPAVNLSSADVRPAPAHHLHRQPPHRPAGRDALDGQRVRSLCLHRVEPPTHDLVRLAGFRQALARRQFTCDVFWTEPDASAVAGSRRVLRLPRRRRPAPSA